MNKIKITPLFSGSGGNCTYIETDNARMLVDAGASARRIKCALSSLGTDIGELDAIFITHEHSDHIAGLRVLTARHDIPIHMTRASYDASGLDIPVITHDTLYTVRLADTLISSFPLSHDTECCVGYKIECGKDRVATMTDTGYVTDEAVAATIGCREILIECNHDIKMLRGGFYPEYLKARILSEKGHLSNDDCAAFCAFLASRGTERFILAHLSKENNTPSCALNTVNSTLTRRKLSADIEVAKVSII